MGQARIETTLLFIYKISTVGDPVVNELLRHGGAPLAEALVPLLT